MKQPFFCILQLEANLTRKPNHVNKCFALKCEE